MTPPAAQVDGPDLVEGKRALEIVVAVRRSEGRRYVPLSEVSGAGTSRG